MSKHASLVDPALLVPRLSHPVGARAVAVALPTGIPDSPASPENRAASTTGSRIATGQGKQGSTEPVTLSIPGTVIRRARVLAATRGMTFSRLVAELLKEAVDNQLPSLLADLQGDEGGDQ
jgi:hypothetical protein